MKVFLKQRMGVLDTWRFAEACFNAERAVVFDTYDEDHLLIDCSKKFFDAEVAKGRILLVPPA